MKLRSIEKVYENLVEVEPNQSIRLIYISDVFTTDKSVFEHIQNHSTTFNKEFNITGFLCNDARVFLQYLEGPKQAVLELMSRIFVDPNHRKVRVILTKPVSGHTFSDWRMHSLNLNNSSWKRQTEPTAMTEFIPFKPDTWQPWFVETFISAMKRFDSQNVDYTSNLITFDSIGFKELELKLSSDSLFFWLFLTSMISTSFVILLFKYDVFYS